MSTAGRKGEGTSGHHWPQTIPSGEGPRGPFSSSAQGLLCSTVCRKTQTTLPSSLSLHSAPLKAKSFSQRTLRPPKPPWVSSYTRVCVHPSPLHCFGLVLCSVSCLRLVGPASGHLELSALVGLAGLQRQPCRGSEQHWVTRAAITGKPA